MKKFFFLSILLVYSFCLKAQNEPEVIALQDTVAATPVVVVNYDSLKAVKAMERMKGYRHFLTENKYVAVQETPDIMPVQKALKETDELFFYLIIALLVFFGIIRVAYPRYINNMAAVLQGSVRNVQIRDQMQQSGQAALLLNILFLLTSSVFISFLAINYQFIDEDEFALGMLYALLVVLAISLVYYCFLKCIGWLFNISSATDSYIFTVFLINKIIGILLLPVLVIMAFSGETATEITIIAFVVILILLILYRIIISYRTVYVEIKLTWLHFFLYLCAFEIAPVLLVYKVLLKLMETN